MGGGKKGEEQESFPPASEFPTASPSPHQPFPGAGELRNAATCNKTNAIEFRMQLYAAKQHWRFHNAAICTKSNAREL